MQHCYIIRPIWFCSKICNVGGRMISAPTQTVPPNYRVEISEHHPYELKNFEPSANYAPGAMRYVCVGEDIIFPVVFPTGKQRRRKAPTMQHQIFCGEIRRYCVATWCIWQRCYISMPIWFCSKTFHVGGRIISAPTRTVPPNFRSGNSAGIALRPIETSFR